MTLKALVALPITLRFFKTQISKFLAHLKRSDRAAEHFFNLYIKMNPVIINNYSFKSR